MRKPEAVRVLRGGSFYDPALYLRAAFRTLTLPEFVFHFAHHDVDRAGALDLRAGAERAVTNAVRIVMG